MLFLISFTRSNPLCDHTTKNVLFQPDHIVHSHYFENVENGYIPTLTLHNQQLKIKDTINWKILNQLEYKEQEHDAYGTVMMPVFSKEVKAFDKKRVVIKGYILPVDRKTYALSKNVYAACFFCGKAGPETVMGLTFKESPGRIKMDTYATISGILKINGTDVEDWMYSLTDVEIIHMKE
ncbi:MAG: hypothetical protein IPL63_12980 [Saprospiraceae bacterium]|nr:hypothetical protein [Saprospiraceae bacterium]MBK8855780.1 hypothetical protein [Saprospiraceae bacterium]